MDRELIKCRHIVNVVLNKLRIYSNRDEFAQIGLIALWKAMEKYNPAFGPLEPYLYMQVHSYVMNELNRKYLLLEREVYDEALFLFVEQKGRE